MFYATAHRLRARYHLEGSIVMRGVEDPRSHGQETPTQCPAGDRLRGHQRHS